MLISVIFTPQKDTNTQHSWLPSHPPQTDLASLFLGEQHLHDDIHTILPNFLFAFLLLLCIIVDAIKTKNRRRLGARLALVVMNDLRPSPTFAALPSPCTFVYAIKNRRGLEMRLVPAGFETR